MDKQELLKGETGERANLKATYKWILEEMDYEDFRRLARLTFFDYNGGYPFEYKYMVDKKHDSKKGREEYMKYLAYKLLQNLDTEGVQLMSTGLIDKDVRLF